MTLFLAYFKAVQSFGAFDRFAFLNIVLRKCHYISCHPLWYKFVFDALLFKRHIVVYSFIKKHVPAMNNIFSVVENKSRVPRGLIKFSVIPLDLNVLNFDNSSDLGLFLSGKCLYRRTDKTGPFLDI